MKTMYQLLFAVCVAIIMASTYQPCSAQVQRVNIITHAITASSCTIGIAEINSGVLTSCTVQITLAFSLDALPISMMTTRATLTMQSSRTTFSWLPGTTARVDVVAITPTTNPAWCNGGWSSPYFVSNPLSSLQAVMTDSRVDSRVTTTFLEPLLQDSLTYVIAAGSIVLLPVAPSPLRLAVAVDTVLTALSRQGFALRDAWVRDFHIGLCQNESPTFNTNIYALIRLQRPSADFFNALAATWTASTRGVPARISNGLSLFEVPRIRETLSSTSQFSRYYNFSTTTSVRTTQQEPELAMRISPQPLSGAGLLTLMVQRPIIADIRVVNMLGQTVATLAQARQFFAGETVISWSAEMLSSGMYAVQFLSGGRILHTQNVVVTR